MSVVEVAFVPAAPLLVPAVAGGSAALDAEMREASIAAVAAATEGCDRVVVVSSASLTGEWSDSAAWDFAGFGVPRDAAIGRVRLPWSLGIGAWLLDESGWDGARQYVGVGAGAEAGEVDTGDDRLAVLVVGDGSACRTEKAPGYLDDRAAAFDAAIESALTAGDAAGLAAVDDRLAAELLCRSLPAWRWVAAAVDGGSVVTATVTFAGAPYGVAYFVARWQL